MRANAIQTNFTSGEVSPQMYGRVDAAKYQNGAAMLRNFIVRPQGGITRRSGTQYAATAQYTSYTRLIPFTASVASSYVLEFGNLYIRFYFNGALVVNATTSNPVQVTSPYYSQDLDQIVVTQSADVMFITHPNYPPQVLTKVDSANWTLVPYVAEDGPYLDTDTTGVKANISLTSDVTTMVAYAQSGTVTPNGLVITASGGYTFNVGMVGQVLALANIGVTSYYTGNNLYLVTSYIDSTHVQVTVISSASVVYIGYGLTLSGTGTGQVVTSVNANPLFTNQVIGSYVFATHSGTTYLCLVTGLVNGTKIQAIVTTIAINTVNTGTYTMTITNYIAGSGNAIFTNASVGKYIEYLVDGTYYLAKILSYVSSTTVTVKVLPQIFTNAQLYNVSVPGTSAAGAAINITSAFTGAFAPSDVGKYIRDSVFQQWAQITSLVNSSTVVGTYLSVFTYYYPNITMVLQNNRVITCNLVFTGNEFVSTDVGRLVRLQFASQWRAFMVTSVTSATSATGTLNDYLPYDLINASNTYNGGWADNFKMGSWSYATGFPAVCGFFDQRLLFANTVTQPSTLWGSQPADYYNMAPTEEDGSVIDSDAINLTLTSGTSDPILWMCAGQVLLCGTSSAEYEVTTPSGSLTPSSIAATQQTSFGALPAANAFRFGVATIFLQRSGNKLRELLYQFQFNAFNCKDITIISEHIFRTRGGAKQIVVQKEPVTIIWIVCNNGDLVSCTYDRDQDIVAFAPHTIANGLVQSAAVVPNLLRDDLYLCVNRTQKGNNLVGTWSIYGGDLYYTYLQMTVTVSDGQTYTYVPSTNAGPDTVADFTAPKFYGPLPQGSGSIQIVPAGTSLYITTKIPVGQPVPAATNQLFLTAVTLNTVELLQSMFDTDTGDTLTTMRFLDCCSYYSGSPATVISGLSFLTGYVVYAIADGNLQGPFTVSGGSITLTTAASNVCVGLNYTSIVGSLSPEGGSPTGTSQGKRKTIKEVTARVKDALPFKHGPSLSQLTLIDASNFAEDLNDLATTGQIVTGDVRFTIDVSWSTQAKWFIQQDQPYPLTIEAVMPILNVNE